MLDGPGVSFVAGMICPQASQMCCDTLLVTARKMFSQVRAEIFEFTLDLKLRFEALQFQLINSTQISWKTIPKAWIKTMLDITFSNYQPFMPLGGNNVFLRGIFCCEDAFPILSFAEMFFEYFSCFTSYFIAKKMKNLLGWFFLQLLLIWTDELQVSNPKHVGFSFFKSFEKISVKIRRLFPQKPKKNSTKHLAWEKFPQFFFGHVE